MSEKLQEATIKALLESKKINIGDNEFNYNNVDDLCVLISKMIDSYNSLSGSSDIISDVLGYSIEELKDLDDTNSEYSISIMTLDPEAPAWNATEEVYVPVKDENEALNIIHDILNICNEDNIDLDEFYEEIEDR